MNSDCRNQKFELDIKTQGPHTRAAVGSCIAFAPAFLVIVDEKARSMFLR
jgi:hypothetical protein